MTKMLELFSIPVQWL